MFQAVKHPFLVPFDGSFQVEKAPTTPAARPLSKKAYKQQRSEMIARLDDLQRLLYAHDRFSLLLIFQAMDAAGKDSTIRSVMRGIDPAGCQVYSFKQPSKEELDHDFLWRTVCRLPERGRIGIFNRSYYEEVLVIRVHPDILKQQKLPYAPPGEEIWSDRFESINTLEKHLARNGTIILKFWLNVSREEQRKRFLSRIEEPEKNWKFSTSDVQEREFWPQYMNAYQEALSTTSKPWAPWYAIPADDKRAMRLMVGDLIIRSLSSLGLQYPEVSSQEAKALRKAGVKLTQEK